ncbi:hypothetical protein BHYA_0045g00080 [Botrytis hyacinthi]|uniref:Uncharacterized protein n=1 Tax=Botrytis hyacinthi TaxID=278943 RepID=A0A4Z1GU60_9HELO|nr:hypothetical protein BHYA_0045g00080 [Botrytis hyacinthi]
MDSKNKKSDRLARHVAEKKAKVQRRVEASIKELYNTCRKLRCDRPIYFFENGKICISLAGSYAFSKAPVFKSRNKIVNVEKTRLDVTQRALRWIEHNPPPPYYCKDGEAENTLVDLLSELALGVYENDTSQEEVQKAMLYLENKIMAKCSERLQRKYKSGLDPARYKRALDVCRFSRLADKTTIGEHANDKVSRALSEADTLFPSFVEAALDFGKWNILADVRSLVIEAEFNGKPEVFFRQLRKWQNNKSLQYLHIFDQMTSDRSPEFLDLALKMCETGVWKHIVENRELIGDLPRCFFNDMFGVSRMIVNGEAVVVARGEHGNFTRDLTPNLRPRLLSTSLTSKLQGLSAWMDSICGTGDNTDQSQLEFENTGSNELAKWGVHGWASNNLDFIGTDPVLFFNELFHLVALLRNGPTSPVVLEAIEATRKIMTGTPVPAGTGEIDASTLSNSTSAVASSSSDMISQSLLPPPEPAFTFDWQRNLSGSNSSAPPKTASTYKWRSSYTGSKSSAPSSSSSARKAKKTDTTLPDPADRIEPTILARGKCFNCPRPGTKILLNGKILCVECRTEPS